MSKITERDNPQPTTLKRSFTKPLNNKKDLKEGKKNSKMQIHDISEEEDDESGSTSEIETSSIASSSSYNSSSSNSITIMDMDGSDNGIEIK